MFSTMDLCRAKTRSCTGQHLPVPRPRRHGNRRVAHTEGTNYTNDDCRHRADYWWVGVIGEKLTNKTKPTKLYVVSLNFILRSIDLTYI